MTSNSRGPVREVVWHEVFPWLILLRALRLALSFRLLLLAFAALIAIAAGWRLIGFAFQGADDEALRGWIETQSAWPWDARWQAVEHITYDMDPAHARTLQLPIVGPYLAEGPIVRAWMWISAPFRLLFQPDQSVVGLAYALLCCVWSVVVWAFFGGAASRIAVSAFARQQTVTLRRATDHARRKLAAYCVAPFMPLIGVLLASLFPFLLGLLMRSDFGVSVAAILWPLVLLFGLVTTILLLGLMFGWPLMWPTIAAEESDAFDALSRSYAYVYQRPLHLVFYAFVASVLGIAAIVLVSVFADAVIYFSRLPVMWGLGDARAVDVFYVDEAAGEAAARTPTGAGLIRFWEGLVRTAQLAFAFAFFWASAAATYLLLRRQVDAADMDEIHPDEPLGTDLPPLETDAQGVPGVKE